MRVYPWSAPGDTAAATCEHAWMYEGDWGCGTGKATVVDSLPEGASPYGALHMAGNVWEWVQDCYHSNYTGAPPDGSEWATGCSSDRVLRGGSFANVAAIVRAANRNFDGAAGSGGFYLGLRCCRSID